MLSEEQKNKIINNLITILKELQHSQNIEEISEKTGIPRRTFKDI